MSLFRAFANNKLTTFFSATHRPYRIVILIATAALIAWSANHAVQSLKHEQTLGYIINQYGENMTALATEQLANSVQNSDAISSQAIAHRIALKAGIASVLVYDNANQILAQSIHSAKHDNPVSNIEYTAPILSSENIIGSVTIVINASSLIKNESSHIEAFVISGLLLCILFCFIKDYIQSKNNLGRTPENHTSKNMPTEPNHILNEEHSAPTTKRHNNIIYLTITIHNIDTLYRQLNGELRQQQMQLLEKNVQHAISLYHGKKLIIDNNKILLVFNEDGQENVVNAIYSAQLLIALHQKCSKSMITMSGLIQESNAGEIVNKTLGNVRSLLKDQSPYSTHIETAMFEKHQLSQRLLYKENETENFSTEITGLKEHYQQLLDNQLTQLLQEGT